MDTMLFCQLAGGFGQLLALTDSPDQRNVKKCSKQTFHFAELWYNQGQK